VVHRNAPLSETGRLRLARCVVEEGWSLRRAAKRFQVSVTTASRWSCRYRALGRAGMADRASRPHRSPTRTPVRTERAQRDRRRVLDPAERLVRRLPSTVRKVLIDNGSCYRSRVFADALANIEHRRTRPKCAPESLPATQTVSAGIGRQAPRRAAEPPQRQLSDAEASEAISNDAESSCPPCLYRLP
jgi:transposase-like protein